MFFLLQIESIAGAASQAGGNQTFEWILIGLLGSAVVGLGIKHFNDQSNHIKDLFRRDHENTIMIAKLQENNQMALEMLKDMKQIVSDHEHRLVRYENEKDY
jgi:hypothetical protein